MKKSSIFYILACMTSLFIFSSCEESVDQVVKTQPDATQEITNRSIDDCEDCPQEYCCCGIELLNSVSVTITICGVYTAMPAVVCPQPDTPPMGCTGTIASHNSVFMLSAMNPRALFCLPEGNMLRIYNHGPNQAIIRFTCQVDDDDPDYGSITLDSGEDAWFDSDGNCFLPVCP